jgi:hypothetical protein
VGSLVKSQPEDPPASSTHTTTTTMLTSTSNMENTRDTSARDRAIASWVRLNPPILPNGEEINAKNTNFDYNEEDHIGNAQHDSNGHYSHHPVRMTATKSFGARDDAIHHHNHTNVTPYHHDLPAVQAIAIEVLPNIVRAKLVETPPETDTNTDLPSPCTTTPPPPIQLPWYRHRVAFWCFWCVNVITFGAVAAGIGVYCGSGNCAPNTKDGTSSSNPTVSPIDAVKEFTLSTFINNITWSGRNLTMQGNTPEDAALQWMIASDDTFHVSLLLKLNSSEANEVQFRIRQRYALLTLWFQQGNK